MKVLVIGSVYPRFQEDAEVPWLRESIKHLKDSGIEVKVLAPAYKGLKNHTIDSIVVERFRYAPASLEILTHDEGAPTKMAKNPFLQLLAIPYILSGMFRCFKIAKKWKPDIIHAHWPFPHGIIAFPAAKIFRVPLVLNFHGAELLLIKKHAYVRPILKFLIKHSNSIFANSSFTASRIKTIFSRDVTISPYGTTLGRANDFHEKTGKFKILFVGRHIERKGLIYLLSAAKLLDAERFEFRIVGHGNLTESLKQFAHRENLRNVLFLGKLPPENLAEEYKNANAFTLPAIVDSKGDTEGLGVVLIEAAEYALPIVASNVGGIPDVVIHEKTGILVQEKSPEALAEAFKTLAENPEFAGTLARNAFTRIGEIFSWEKITEKQIDVYKSLK